MEILGWFEDKFVSLQGGREWRKFYKMLGNRVGFVLSLLCSREQKKLHGVRRALVETSAYSLIVKSLICSFVGCKITTLFLIDKKKIKKILLWQQF